MTGLVARSARVFADEGLAGITRRLARRQRRQAFRLARSIRRGTFRSAYGVKLVANWGDVTFRYCALGAYGEVLSSYLAGQSRPFVFLDIGANQGLYSILAAQNPACQRVYAFEPVPDTAEILARNLALNGVSGRCEILRKAVSGRCGSASISVQEGHSGAASVAHDLDQSHSITIETMDGAALGALLEAETAPCLVKVDVEGHEAVVIDQFLRGDLAKRIAAIFYECDERWIDAAALRARLQAAGFAHIQKFGQGHHYDVLAQRAPAT